MSADNNDPHLRQFTKSLSSKIKGYKEHTGDQIAFVKSQKAQVRKLNDLEDQFRVYLTKTKEGKAAYAAFVAHIRDNFKNILDARPFFRERQTLFTSNIATALKSRQPHKLYPYRFNYLFVNFAMSTGLKDPVYHGLFKQIKSVRNKLIEVNAPLAIARASQFYRKTPKTHLTRMDLIQVALEGLANGIDKFSGKYDPTTYRHMVIGRITGSLIGTFSETMVHFYPMDKRKLYNANKVLRKCETPESYDQISNNINHLTKEVQYSTTPEEVFHLMRAANVTSIEAVISPDQGGESGGITVQDTRQFADEDSKRPDNSYESKELNTKLTNSINGLSVFERKILKMKGIA